MVTGPQAPPHPHPARTQTQALAAGETKGLGQRFRLPSRGTKGRSGSLRSRGEVWRSPPRTPSADREGDVRAWFTAAVSGRQSERAEAARWKQAPGPRSRKPPST